MADKKYATGFVNTEDNKTYYYKDEEAVAKDEIGNGLTINNANELSLNMSNVAMKSKTFTTQNASGTLIYGSSNDTANASFYFGKIRPTTWRDATTGAPNPYMIHLRILCTVGGSQSTRGNYMSHVDLYLFGTGGARNIYRYYSWQNNTSYRALYYTNWYTCTETGYNNGYGHLVGVGLRSATNGTSSSYPRVIKVDVVETMNCDFEFFDYAMKYANVEGTGSTNYSGLTELDCNSNMSRPDNDTVSMLRNENGRVYAGTSGIFPYSLICMDNNGQFQSLTTSGTTATTKAYNRSAKFMANAQIFYYGSNSTATVGNLVPNTYALYQKHPNVDLRYSCNCGDTGFATNKPVYVECIIDKNNGTWSPTSKGITQTLVSGYYYVYLGIVYSTAYLLSLSTEHPIYYYDGTNLKSYIVGAVPDNIARVIDLNYFDTLGSTLPTLNAVFMYGDSLTHHRTIYDYNNELGEIDVTLYHVFCMEHDREYNESAGGYKYMVYHSQDLTYVTSYDTTNGDTVPDIILRAFGEATATDEYDGLMSAADKRVIDELETSLNGEWVDIPEDQCIGFTSYNDVSNLAIMQTIPYATQESAGAMSAADKAKLDGIDEILEDNEKVIAASLNDLNSIVKDNIMLAMTVGMPFEVTTDAKYTLIGNVMLASHNRIIIESDGIVPDGKTSDDDEWDLAIGTDTATESYAFGSSFGDLLCSAHNITTYAKTTISVSNANGLKGKLYIR